MAIPRANPACELKNVGGRMKMRGPSFDRTVLLLGLLALAACSGNEVASMSKTPLLPAGTELDLIRISEAVWAREAAVGAKDLSHAERVFLCVWNLEAEVNNVNREHFYEP